LRRNNTPQRFSNGRSEVPHFRDDEFHLESSSSALQRIINGTKRGRAGYRDAEQRAYP
jgi:hypothetical protein